MVPIKQMIPLMLFLQQLMVEIKIVLQTQQVHKPIKPKTQIKLLILRLLVTRQPGLIHPLIHQ